MTCFLFFRFFVVYALSWHWHCSFSSNFETIVICNSSVGTKRKDKRDGRETACRSSFSRHKNVQICKYSANIDARADSTAISGDGVVSFTQYRRISYNQEPPKAVPPKNPQRLPLKIPALLRYRPNWYRLNNRYRRIP